METAQLYILNGDIYKKTCKIQISQEDAERINKTPIFKVILATKCEQPEQIRKDEIVCFI